MNLEWNAMKCLSKKFVLLVSLACVMSMLVCGCKKDNPEPRHVDAGLVAGKWVRNNSQEYWRYDIGYTGETWDESEDVREGEGTHFNWTVVEDQLRLDLYGEMGQHVYYDYYVAELSAASMVLVDEYGTSNTFSKLK